MEAVMFLAGPVSATASGPPAQRWWRVPAACCIANGCLSSVSRWAGSGLGWPELDRELSGLLNSSAGEWSGLT